MKILVREYNDFNGICNYVWKNVRKVNPFRKTYHDFGYYDDNGVLHPSTNVLRIKGDYRKLGYVMCANCGEIVKKGDEIKHYEKREREINCAKCPNLGERRTKNKTYTIKPDGTAIVKYAFDPICTASWNYRSIAEVDKPAKCIYFACRRSEMVDLPSDFLVTYTNPYKDFLTENAAIAAGWNYISKSTRGRQYASDKNGKLIACFDTNGILINFELSLRNMVEHFTYSDVYDKFFCRGEEFNWFNGVMSETTKAKYMKQVRKLYNS